MSESMVEQRTKKDNELPRGLRKRNGSYVAYLTHPDGHGERRAIGNVSEKMAIQQRQIWMRELAEAKYVKKVSRRERPTFAVIADAALERAKKYKRSWDTDAGRIGRMKEWWGDRIAEEIDEAEIEEKLSKGVTPKGAGWSEETQNEYRVLLVKIFALAIDRKQLTDNPAKKAHRFKLHNARTRKLSNDEEIRLRAAILKLYPSKIWEFYLALHTGARASNFYGIHGKGRKPMEPLDWKQVDLKFRCIRFPRSKIAATRTPCLSTRIVIDASAICAAVSVAIGTGPVIRKPKGGECHSYKKWFNKCLAEAASRIWCGITSGTALRYAPSREQSSRRRYSASSRHTHAIR